jgi:hypothetical protein
MRRMRRMMVPSAWPAERGMGVMGGIGGVF